MSIRFESISGRSLDTLLERKTSPVRAIPTPFPGWNAVCGEEGGRKGLARGWLCTIGGVTGTGKSYLAANLASRAVHAGKRVGIINFEMSFMGVATRFLSILTGVPKWQLEMGPHFSAEAWLQAKKIAEDIQAETGGVMVTNESNVFDIRDIEESFRQLTDAGVGMIVVDYAQLVTVPGTDGIYQRSETVANRLRDLTHEYDVVTVPLSQFNREEARRNKRPSKFGLLGGGIWEHASNQIWLLNHTLRYRYGDDGSGRPLGEFTELICDKNRHGMEIDLKLQWDYETMRFSEVLDPEALTHDHPFVEEGSQAVVVDAPRAEPQRDPMVRDMFVDDNQEERYE